MKGFQLFLETLRCHSALPCIESEHGCYTYAELVEEIERWHLRFDQMDVQPGMVVGLRSEYSLQAIAALFALLSRRSIAALVPRDRATDNYLADSRAAAFLDLQIDGRYEWRAISNADSHPLLEQLRSSGDGGIVLFTSGSTGRPKAALQSVERFLAKFRKPGRRFRTLAFLLFDHIAGQDTLFYVLGSGGALILTHRRDPASILAIIERHRVEVLPTSPSFLRFLCFSNLWHEHDLSSLKIITYGSEPMDPHTLARLNVHFPDIQISQKYGATEAGSPRTVSKGSDSLWLKFKGDGVDVKVVDGVLWVRSESVILGYLNAPSPVDEAGWYCTGDLVDFDGEWLKFRGRLVDTINVGGEKVSPAEVEHTILELDFVTEVVVTGAPHPLLGQIVTARVRLRAVETEPRKAITRIWRHCRQRLAPYKAPVKIDLSFEELTNDRYKVRRHSNVSG